MDTITTSMSVAWNVKRRRLSILGLACTCVIGTLVGSAPPASADVIYSTGNQQYDNVNLVADTNAFSVTGDIGNTGFHMTFNTMMGPYTTQNGTQVEMHCQHGVAFCESFADSQVSTADHTGFSSITLSAVGTTAWTAGDFSLDLLGQTDGTVTFTAYMDGVLVPVTGSSTFAIDATGQNQYNFLTKNGETIDQLVITSTSPFNLADIKQVSLQAIDVPEPATMSLFGAGLFMVGLFGWRRSKSVGRTA